MFYPKTDFCPFNSDAPYLEMGENGVECPINDSELFNNDDNKNNCNKNDCHNNNNNNNNNMETFPTPDTKSEMMRKLQEIGFAIIDLNLFLDTHPESTEALELYRKLCASQKSLKSDYQASYGPLYAHESRGQIPFEWVEDGRKWPWEV